MNKFLMRVMIRWRTWRHARSGAAGIICGLCGGLTYVTVTAFGPKGLRTGCRPCVSATLVSLYPPDPAMRSSSGTISPAHVRDIRTRRRAPDGSVYRDTGRRSLVMGV